MKVIMKKVYYCDFCKKHGLRSIATHESHCTGNPDRDCRMCENQVPIKPIIEKYKALVVADDHLDEDSGQVWTTWGMSNEFKMEDLLSDTEGCPACTLTVIRCAGFPPTVEWSYKKAVDEWWASRNAQDWQEQERNAYYG